jgi:hypothetical protein
MLRFDEASTLIAKIHERKQEKLLNITQCLMKQKRDLKRKFFMQDSFEIEVEAVSSGKSLVYAESQMSVFSELHELDDIRVDANEAKSKRKAKTKERDESLPNYAIAKPPTTRNEAKLDISEFLQTTDDHEATLSEIQKYMKNLTRAFSEDLQRKEPKFENLMTASKQSEHSENSAAKFLKLSQVKGRLKPQESRIISVYFVGSNEGKLCIF